VTVAHNHVQLWCPVRTPLVSCTSNRMHPLIPKLYSNQQCPRPLYNSQR